MKLTKIWKTLLVLAAVMNFVLVAACSDDDDPTCSSALNNLYDQGCTMVDGYGDPIARSDAIEGCYDTEEDARQTGCLAYFDDALDCMDSIGQEQCTYCNPELEDLFDCMGS